MARKSLHETRCEKARDAIVFVANDDTVSLQRRAKSLDVLRDKINSLLDTLESRHLAERRDGRPDDPWPEFPPTTGT